jgi:3-oxoacyl-[acyl-carrier protein] reductase
MMQKQRVAVVTGGAMGIGGESVAQLARTGHHVVIADRDTAAAAQTAEQLAQEGLSVSTVEIDVGKAESTLRRAGQQCGLGQGLSLP